MNELFDLVERKNFLSIELGWNSVADWCCVIRDKGSNKANGIVNTQSCDRIKCLSQAYVELAEYLLEEKGGY